MLRSDTYMRDNAGMGYLNYAGVEHEVEDRALAHVKAAVSQRLRRQEAFFISWSNPVEKGSGRVSIWVSPNIPLTFRFSGSRPPELNPVWVEALTTLSHTARGMVIITESEAESFMRDKKEGE